MNYPFLALLVVMLKLFHFWTSVAPSVRLQHYLSTFLLPQTTHFVYIFLALALELIIPPKSPGNFQQRMVFKSQYLSTSCAHCYQLLHCFQPHSVFRARKYNTNTYTHIFLHLPIYILRTMNLSDNFNISPTPLCLFQLFPFYIYKSNRESSPAYFINIFTYLGNDRTFRNQLSMPLSKSFLLNELNICFWRVKFIYSTIYKSEMYNLINFDMPVPV